MAKYYGKIGFATTVEDPVDSGIWKEKITARPYSGDVLNNTRRIELADNVNADLNISNRISIVADPYAKLNFHSMRYAEYLGSKWRITSVEVSFPRLILNLGGLYNGEN